jgi:hypothetical protein
MNFLLPFGSFGALSVLGVALPSELFFLLPFGSFRRFSPRSSLSASYSYSTFYSLLGVSAPGQVEIVEEGEAVSLLSTPFWEFLAATARITTRSNEKTPFYSLLGVSCQT